VAFFPWQPATYASRNWLQSIVNRPFFAICETHRSLRESAAPANSRRSVVAHEHVPMRSLAMQTPKSPAASISPGDTFSVLSE
jgi:hypothetical protein